MLILGIDTATSQAGCAIGGHEGVIASAQCAKGRRHAENLAPAIEFICSQSQIELSEISVIAVDLGPGLFTGLRVGIATGKGLAHALGVPMIGVASLDLLAFAVRDQLGRGLLTIVGSLLGSVVLFVLCVDRTTWSPSWITTFLDRQLRRKSGPSS